MIQHVLHLFLSLVTLFFFFFNDTATTEIYTLSLHDALPISLDRVHQRRLFAADVGAGAAVQVDFHVARSEEHTSELQSRLHLVCRLLLEKKKKNDIMLYTYETQSQGHIQSKIA